MIDWLDKVTKVQVIDPSTTFKKDQCILTIYDKCGLHLE